MALSRMREAETLKGAPVYEAPAIIYEGEITARAGSVAPEPPPGEDEFDTGIDPSDLFGNG